MEGSTVYTTDHDHVWFLKMLCLCILYSNYENLWNSLPDNVVFAIYLASQSGMFCKINEVLILADSITVNRL